MRKGVLYTMSYHHFMGAALVLFAFFYSLLLSYIPTYLNEWVLFTLSASFLINCLQLKAGCQQLHFGGRAANILL